MKILRIEDMKDGWFVGDFSPTAFSSKNFEVNYRVHPKGQIWDAHYHTTVTEINLLISGRMQIQDQLIVSGDIFIIYPLEIADPIFLEECSIICVKTPSLNDKVLLPNA